MTLILIEKGLVSEGSTPKIEDKQVPGIYIYNPPTKLTLYRLPGPGTSRIRQA